MFRTSRLIALSALLLATASCSEFAPPAGDGEPVAGVAIAPEFDPAGLALQTTQLPITRVRLTAKLATGGTVLETRTVTVSPDAEEWRLNFSIPLPPDANAAVVVTIELINVGTGGETVVWSGITDPFILQPGPAGEPLPVPVFPGPLDNLGVTSVTITPDGGTVDEGSTLPLAASAQGGTGNTVVFWTSLNPSVASVSEQGTVTGVVPGTARIVASAGARADTVTITVRARVASIVVSPAAATLQSFGATQAFTARALDPRGAEVLDVAFTFSVTPTSVATHEGGGVMRAVGNGTATVQATARGVNGTATLTVAQTAASVVVSPPSATIATIGGTVTLTAEVRDANGNVVVGAPITWTSSAPNVASVVNGLVTGLAAGSTTITARNSPTLAGTATVNVGSQTLLSDGFEGAFTWTVSPIVQRTTGAQVTNRAHPLYVVSAGGPALPSAPQGTFYLWFGFPGEGNYMGTQQPGDLANSGGTGTAPQGGSATSAAFNVPQAVSTIYISLRSWFEIEGVSPDQFDLMQVAIVDAVTDQVIAGAFINTGLQSTDTEELPTTSGGVNVPPVFVPLTFQATNVAGRSLRVRLTFSTEDIQYNGFRGWVVDDIRVTTSPPAEAPQGASARALAPCVGACQAAAVKAQRRR